MLTGEVIKVYILIMACIFDHSNQIGSLSMKVYMAILNVCFLLQLADRLRHSEGQFSEAGVCGAELEPDWLQQLRARHHSFQVVSFSAAFISHNVYLCLRVKASDHSAVTEECGEV